jgi:hypothetical protein
MPHLSLVSALGLGAGGQAGAARDHSDTGHARASRPLALLVSPPSGRRSAAVRRTPAADAGARCVALRSLFRGAPLLNPNPLHSPRVFSGPPLGFWFRLGFAPVAGLGGRPGAEGSDPAGLKSHSALPATWHNRTSVTARPHHGRDPRRRRGLALRLGRAPPCTIGCRRKAQNPSSSAASYPTSSVNARAGLRRRAARLPASGRRGMFGQARPPAPGSAGNPELPASAPLSWLTDALRVRA